MTQLHFSVITDRAQAKVLWERFSPKRSLFDDWNVRSCFATYPKTDLFYIVGSINERPIGILPLQKNPEHGYLEFFGGRFMEDNQVFLSPEYQQMRAAFYAHVPAPARLEYLIGDDIYTQSLPRLEDKYTLPLTGLQCADDYLKKFLSAKSRATMRRKIEKIDALGITILENRFSDLDYLITLNIKRHGATSTFHLPHRRQIFESLFRVPTVKQYFLSFLLNGEVIGTSFSQLYATTFVYLNAGVDTDRIPNLGAYVIFKNIEYAIMSGATTFDACIGDYGWKERWHLQKTPQHQLIKE